MKKRTPSREQVRGDGGGSKPIFAGALRARRARRPARLRLVCGVLAAGLLGMLAIGSLREAGAVYREPWPAGAGELHMPSLPPPPFPKALGPNGEVKERARFLLHVVAVPLDYGLEPRPRLVREIDIEWPRDRGRVIECRVRTRAGMLSRRLELEEVRSGTFVPRRWRHRENLETAYDWLSLHLSGSRKLKAGGSWSGGSGADVSLRWTDAAQRIGEQGQKEEYRWGVSLGRSCGSLVPRRVPAHIAFGVLAWRVALEDPLAPARAEALPSDIPLRDLHGASYSGVGTEATFAPGALSYFGHVRWGLAPLFASVVLLTQLFRRRELAFLALLVAAVLLGAALDRYTVGVHLGRLGRLADPAAPAEERALALDSIETTFFYRPSALAAARRVAAGEAEPEILRQKAASAVSRLEATLGHH